MNPNTPHPATLMHTQVAAAPGGQLVIENLDVPAEQSGALFTVTYTITLPVTGTPAA